MVWPGLKNLPGVTALLSANQDGQEIISRPHHSKKSPTKPLLRFRFLQQVREVMLAFNRGIFPRSKWRPQRSKRLMVKMAGTLKRARESLSISPGLTVAIDSASRKVSLLLIADQPLGVLVQYGSCEILVSCLEGFKEKIWSPHTSWQQPGCRPRHPSPH